MFQRYLDKFGPEALNTIGYNVELVNEVPFTNFTMPSASTADGRVPSPSRASSRSPGTPFFQLSAGHPFPLPCARMVPVVSMAASVTCGPWCGVCAGHVPCFRGCMSSSVCQAWMTNGTLCTHYDRVPTARQVNSTIPVTSGVKRDPLMKVKLSMGSFSKGAGLMEAYFDDLMYYVPASTPVCEPVKVVSAVAPRRSCWEHFRAGATQDGMYVVDRAGGHTKVFCKMTLAGGGWDLLSNVVSSPFGVSVRSHVCAPLCFGTRVGILLLLSPFPPRKLAQHAPVVCAHPPNGPLPAAIMRAMLFFMFASVIM